MVCHDIERNRTDERGFDCEFYDQYPNECGSLDSDSFKSDELCCACGGGTSHSVQFCQDTDKRFIESDLVRYVNADGLGCKWYNDNPLYCG